jgi:tetratricopeptide (TPR) repeat protein
VTPRPGGPAGALRRAFAAALAAVVCALAVGRAAGAGAPELVPVPVPDLAEMEPAVAAQLAEQRRLLETLRAAPEADDEALAEAFGATGRLYLLHELVELAAACFANAEALAPDDFRWPYLRGIVAARRGELEAGVAAFRRALEDRPGEATALLRLGMAELARGRLEEASTALTAASAHEPLRAATHFELGRIAQSRGEAATAARHFEDALALQPEAIQLHYPLALAYRDLGDRARAEEHLARAGRGRISFPDPLLDDLAELSRGTSMHLFNAGAALATGRIDDAISEYRQALAKDPDNVQAAQGLAGALARDGQLEAAVTAYRRTFELAPEDPATRSDLGMLLLASGRLDEAARELTTAVALAPDFAPAHAHLAALYARTGRFAEALDALERLLALRPEDLDARRQRAVVLLEVSREGEAIAALEALAAADPADAASRLHLGRALAVRGEAERARQAFGEVLVAAGDNSALAARAHLGLARLRTGDEALRHLEAAVAAAPAWAEARYELGAALLAAGRAADAVVAFERAVQLAPEGAPAHLGRARALRVAEGCGRALPALESSLVALPGNGDVVHLLARFLATCPRTEGRDGERALALALRVFEAQPSFAHAETVAMAQAALGRWAAAVAWQERALALGERTGVRSEALVAARRRLDAYRRGMPMEP